MLVFRFVCGGIAIESWPDDHPLQAFILRLIVQQYQSICGQDDLNTQSTAFRYMSR
ncbi:hypothetical protein Pr1d_32520 [Bythopirellula goksoeyrii]|uniref:Uncharacterized protein n=1 Tax=Bythopirellula goksoeyrii TaxID=1400387 RepID=A0A5B9QA57_9BACT|nr:hypothetical protein Pr1d_32520 [Bythopirellula goksoeyrii]